jgi:regulator of RNase E activity RraA
MLVVPRASRQLEDSVAITHEQIEELRGIDTPTILNAIEKFDVQPKTLGFTGTVIRNLAPELGVMIGYAVTALGDTMSEAAPKDASGMFQMWEAIEATQNPVVLVIKDFSDDPTHSVQAGDGMATLAKVLGADGMVTDGALRDPIGIKEVGVKMFARGLAPSHANNRIVGAQIPVTIDGMDVNPGDLIHGDENGLCTIPLGIAGQVAAVAKQIWEAEEKTRQDYLKPDFGLDDYAKARGITRRPPS